MQENKRYKGLKTGKWISIRSLVPGLLLTVRSASCDVIFRFSYPGGVLNKWLHICSSINVATTVATVYINGEYFATITTSIIKPLVHTGGKLIIGRDQDAYWGGFGTNDVSFGR